MSIPAKRAPPVLGVMALWLGLAGGASAQSCWSASPALTRCGLTAIERSPFVIQASAALAAPARSRAPGVTVEIRVDGWPCPAEHSAWRTQIYARCRTTLAPGAHVVESSLQGADGRAQGISVQFLAPDRLADLPHDPQDLYPAPPPPKPRPKRKWSVFGLGW